MWKFFIHLLVICVLTVISQVGGIIYGLVFLMLRKRHILTRLSIFMLIYLLISFFLLPPLAKLGGRVPITSGEWVRPVSAYVYLLNRNYVKPELNQVLQDQAEKLQRTHPGIQLVYLDAGFPFWEEFPLLPHRSHNDGEKVDLAFIYQKNGTLLNDKPSLSGYGVFEEPKNQERVTTPRCLREGYWWYDYNKYATFWTLDPDISVHGPATATLMRNLIQDRRVGKILLEPHLVNRWKLDKRKARFHGCYAVRHDDHVHVQL